ncbi:ABC transporter permease [bacterium]|nr:ABC transporter permease [bacterium]
MTFKATLRLALSDPRESPRKTWPLLLGLVFGIATWVVLTGFTRGATNWLRERVGGSLPNRIRVSSSKTQFGPLQLGGGLNDDTVAACKAIAGVEEVYRQAHYPGPCQLFANYSGQRMTTDLILEGVDPGQVLAQLPTGAAFEDTSGSQVPAVVPQPVLDILNAGISAHTNLPNLSEQALIGRGFELRVGSSSFAPGPSIDIRCNIVGVSDQLGVNGPAVPLAWVQRNSKRPLEYHTLTLQLAPGANLESVLRAVDRLHLAAPDLETAKRIGQAAVLAQVLAAAFAGAILLVAGVGIGSGFTVKVQLEQPDIGLYRSLGATRRDIARLYLVRATSLGMQGAIWGLLAGLFVGQASATLILSQLPKALSQGVTLFQPSPASLLTAVFFAPMVAVGAAWLPARQAANLEPGRILRNGG